jgi:hypothetical protein
MTNKKVSDKEQKAFEAGVVFGFNKIIDMIQNQIDTCPVGIEECSGCQQDLRLLNTILQGLINEDNSQTL